MNDEHGIQATRGDAAALARAAKRRRLLTIVAVPGAGAVAGWLLALAVGYGDPAFAAAVAAMLGMTSLPLFVLLTAPKRGRIVLLRKFGAERPPAFPISTIVSKLRLDGFRVVTLADSVIEADEDSARLVAMALGLFLSLPLLGLLLLGPAWVVASLTDKRAAMALAVMPAVLAAIAVIVTGGRIVAVWQFAVVEGLMMLLRRARLGRIGLADVPADGVAQALSRKLDGRWKAGITVVAASDRNWREVVRYLVDDAALILIDVSTPTQHLLTEVSMIAARIRGERVLWLRRGDDAMAYLSPAADGYTAFGHRIDGPLRVFDYPATADVGYYRAVGRVAGDPTFWSHVDRLRVEAMRSEEVGACPSPDRA